MYPLLVEEEVEVVEEVELVAQVKWELLDHHKAKQGFMPSPDRKLLQPQTWSLVSFLSLTMMHLF